MTDAIVVLPDWQVPLHDQKKILAVARFIGDFQPMAVAHVGDMTDSTQLGRWARGLRKEFDGGLEGAFVQTRWLLDYHRAYYDGPFHLMKSNHDERLELAIEQRLPGIAELTIRGQKLNIQNALRLEDYGVTWHDQPYAIAPGWLLMHGDEGGTSSIPGNTALGLARGAWSSVVCGHSHRAGIAWTTVGVGEQRSPMAGLEVGHMMQLSGAEYLGRARLANWANAFGILWLHRRNKKKTEVHPQLVPVHPDGSFMVGGERYR